MFAQREYIRRHNDVCEITYQQISLILGMLQDWKFYYRYVLLPVLENKHYLLYWNRNIQTDHLVVNNRPDIVQWEKHAQDVKIIDIAILLWQQHPAELYNQDPEEWTAKARNHRNVETGVNYRLPHCNFSYEGRTCEVRNSAEWS